MKKLSSVHREEIEIFLCDWNVNEGLGSRSYLEGLLMYGMVGFKKCTDKALVDQLFELAKEAFEISNFEYPLADTVRGAVDLYLRIVILTKKELALLLTGSGPERHIATLYLERRKKARKKITFQIIYD